MSESEKIKSRRMRETRHNRKEGERCEQGKKGGRRDKERTE